MRLGPGCFVPAFARLPGGISGDPDIKLAEMFHLIPAQLAAKLSIGVE
jgi:hypothetical protein